MKVELAPFTKFDWFAWAGAAHFPNDKVPLIYSSAIATLVVDGNGMELFWGKCLKPDNSDNHRARWDHDFLSQSEGRLVAYGVLVRLAAAQTDAEVEVLAREACFIFEREMA